MMIVKAVLLLLLPLVVFFAGAFVMKKLSGRAEVERQLREKAPADAKPLNQRIGGYDLEAVSRHWGALDETARRRERLFMRLDLAFPLLYGGAFAYALCRAWMELGKPGPPALLFAPVVLGVVADWTENLVQLGQLRRFGTSGKAGLQAGRIALASTATRVKLLFLAAALLLLFVLAGCMIVSA